MIIPVQKSDCTNCHDSMKEWVLDDEYCDATGSTQRKAPQGAPAPLYIWGIGPEHSPDLKVWKPKKVSKSASATMRIFSLGHRFRSMKVSQRQNQGGRR